MKQTAPLKTVIIPAFANHAGIYSMQVTLEWKCPQCGGPRGEIFKTISWDGSRRLHCDGWKNPCGHIDTYNDVRDEAFANIKNHKGVPTMHAKGLDNDTLFSADAVTQIASDQDDEQRRQNKKARNNTKLLTSELKVSVCVSWWVYPFLYLAQIVLQLVGKAPSDEFIKKVVNAGVKVESPKASQKLTPLQRKISCALTIFFICLGVLVWWGIRTDCPDTEGYVYCAPKEQ